MKKIFFSPLLLIMLFAVAFTNCTKDEVLYGGNDYVMFSDSLAYMPVTTVEDNYFEVEVAATKVSSKDRNYAVELVANKSNAIEGYHYDFVTRNLTIKAGELSGKIKMKGHYDNIIYGEKLEFTLRLLAPKDQNWDIYGNESRISLIKCPDFNIEKFTGNLRMYAAFPFNDKYITFFVKSEKQDDSTLIIKAPFDKAYDMKLRFHTNAVNPMENKVTIFEQVAFPDLSYGQVFLKGAETVRSYYVTEARMIDLYLDVFVPSVGSFGVHRYMLQWVPQSEVDADNNNTGTPFSLERALNPTL
ncbi:MAG: DUF4984 domain-containing protein [Bacteroidales bacterium]